MSRHRVLEELRLNVDGPCFRAIEPTSYSGHNHVDSVMHETYDSYLCYAVRGERTSEAR